MGKEEQDEMGKQPDNMIPYNFLLYPRMKANSVTVLTLIANRTIDSHN